MLVLDFLGHISLPLSPPSLISPNPRLVFPPRSVPEGFIIPPPHIILSLLLILPFSGRVPFPLLNISLNSSRVFLAADGRQFEWRRCDDDPHSYDASLFPRIPLIRPSPDFKLLRTAFHRPHQPENRNLPTVPPGYTDRTLLRLHVLSIRQRAPFPRIPHRPLSKQMVGPPRAHNATPIEHPT